MRHMSTYRLIDAVEKHKSLRKAAEHTALTPSALNRRILNFEEEFGTPIFERTSNGLRLNAAGEIIIHHIRTQLADFDRVQSQIADLSGLRRGSVSIYASQCALEGFLPFVIAQYKSSFPMVSFHLFQAESEKALRALYDYSADVVIGNNFHQSDDLSVFGHIQQSVCVLMNRDHPLADLDEILFEDCLTYEMALPAHGLQLRKTLEHQARARDIRLNSSLEGDALAALSQISAKSDILSFRLSMATTNVFLPPSLISRPIKDLDAGAISLCHLKGRQLSVATSRFCELIKANAAELS